MPIFAILDGKKFLLISSKKEVIAEHYKKLPPEVQKRAVIGVKRWALKY